MSFRTIQKMIPRIEALKQFIKDELEGEVLVQDNLKLSNDYDSHIQVFLHTHAISVPIPISKYVTRLTFEQSMMGSYGTANISLRMPLHVLQLITQNEGTEMGTGHWISIRSVSDNPFVDYYQKAAVTPISDKAMKKAEADATAQAEKDLGAGGATAAIRAGMRQHLREKYLQKNKEALQAKKAKGLKRLKSAASNVYFKTFYIGQISNIDFGYRSDPNGTTRMTDVTLTVASFVFPLQTSNYKIVNADIDRSKKNATEEIEYLNSGLSHSGARFIIDLETFKNQIIQIKNSVASAEDPKFGIEQLLRIYGYMLLPRSLITTSKSVKSMLSALEKIKTAIQTPKKTTVGTSKELLNLTKVAALKAKHKITQLKSNETGNIFTNEEASGLTEDQFMRIFTLDDDATIDVVGSKPLHIGWQIKVCTEKSDLPVSAAYLRSMLPDNTQYFRNIARFRELQQQNGTPWTRILGSFVPSPDLIDFYPVIVPFNEQDKKYGFVSYGDLADKTNTQLCLVWRIKPLRPWEALNTAFYNQSAASLNQDQVLWKKIEPTTITFKSEAVDSDGGAVWTYPMNISLDKITELSVGYDEAGRVNGAYLEHPFMSSENNLKFGVKTQPVIDVHNAQLYGFRMFESRYPFLDATKNKIQRDALTEKAYAIKRDTGAGAIGSFSMVGVAPDALWPGIWVQIHMDSGEQAARDWWGNIQQGRNMIDRDGHRYPAHNMLTCLVTSIVRSIDVDALGNKVRRTTVKFHRGKWNQSPTIMPVSHDFGRPESSEKVKGS
jgi:hypothetical protein